MTYQETLDYLYSQLPMFHRIGPAAYKANLNNTLAIIELLDHPEKDFRSIHIAGTNGKGSVSNMLAAILQAHGYKTGLFTSPHLIDFRERIRINGNMIPKAEVTRFVKRYRRDFEEIKPSFFEWTAGLAFDYFSRMDVDIAVIETGLGGRLDSTNVITPLVSVITNVQWDHMHLLGNTLKKIAKEKAGIIKPGIPVVIGEDQKGVTEVFRTVAKKNQSDLYLAPKTYKAVISEESQEKPGMLHLDILRNKRTWMKDVTVDLGGWYQMKNICTVFQALDILQDKGFETDRKRIRKALANVKKITGFAGRWQVIDKHPLTICDTAHNADGVELAMSQLSKQSYTKLHMVIGMVADKDVTAVLKLLPKQAAYYFCKPAIPRGLDSKELKKKAAEFQLTGKHYTSVSDALSAARDQAGRNDLIYVGGSTFVVGECLEGK